MSQKTLDELQQIFMARANAVNPPPSTREEILATLAKLYRVEEHEAEVLMQCFENTDHGTAKLVISDFLTRESFLREPDQLG